MTFEELVDGLKELYGPDKVTSNRIQSVPGLRQGWIYLDLIDTLDVSVHHYDADTRHGWAKAAVRVAVKGKSAYKFITVEATVEAVADQLHGVMLAANSKRLDDLERLADELSSEGDG